MKARLALGIALLICASKPTTASAQTSQVPRIEVGGEGGLLGSSQSTRTVTSLSALLPGYRYRSEGTAITRIGSRLMLRLSCSVMTYAGLSAGCELRIS